MTVVLCVVGAVIYTFGVFAIARLAFKERIDELVRDNDRQRKRINEQAGRIMQLENHSEDLAEVLDHRQAQIDRMNKMLWIKLPERNN